MKTDPHFVTIAQSYASQRERLMSTLDIAGARATMRKYHLPEPDSDFEVLRGLHRARLRWTKCPTQLRQESEDWLKQHKDIAYG